MTATGTAPESKAPVARAKTYRTERQLVRDFVGSVTVDHAAFGPLQLTREFFYQRGRTDVVGVCSEGTVLAFEAKLTKWRTALQQAYRNTCFAHRSYVVLPWSTAQLANQYVAEFQRRKVGLCTVRDGSVVVLQAALRSEPIEPWLSRVATSRTRRRRSHASA
jgi:hypothetical protein